MVSFNLEKNKIKDLGICGKGMKLSTMAFTWGRGKGKAESITGCDTRQGEGKLS